ncbi:hypothetical protein DAI22_05g286800 [Oryza sativa Japonica Group]|jgi:hypothetical protein|nr:hypothetical protein DAI22_05g286800 [Oryza sativa Japonica Group]
MAAAAMILPLLLLLCWFLLLSVGDAMCWFNDDASASAPAGWLVSWTNGMGWYKGMPREFVDGHNQLRARYGLQPMRWDNKLTRQARRWSDAMRGDCQIRHSTGNSFAESLYIGRNGWNARASDAVRCWGDEEHLYDRDTGKCTAGVDFHECGHFAFMVRPNFTRIGCARAECFNGGVFITCNYFKDEQHQPATPPTYS